MKRMERRNAGRWSARKEGWTQGSQMVRKAVRMEASQKEGSKEHGKSDSEETRTLGSCEGAREARKSGCQQVRKVRSR